MGRAWQHDVWNVCHVLMSMMLGPIHELPMRQQRLGTRASPRCRREAPLHHVAAENSANPPVTQSMPFCDGAAQLHLIQEGTSAQGASPRTQSCELGPELDRSKEVPEFRH